MKRVLKAFVIVSLMFLSACAWTQPTLVATETEVALCEAWRDSLPSRSRSDTEQTQAEIGVAYDKFLAACPDQTLPF